MALTVRLFSKNSGDPGLSADLFLKSGRDCKKRFARYQPTADGNLEYFYDEIKFSICIGSESVKAGKWEPSKNECPSKKMFAVLITLVN